MDGIPRGDLQPHELAAMMMIVQIAHDRYMTIAHRTPTDIEIEPISFSFPEEERTVRAAVWLTKHGYTATFNERRKCVISALSPLHFENEEVEKENHLDPSSMQDDLAS